MDGAHSESDCVLFPNGFPPLSNIRTDLGSPLTQGMTDGPFPKVSIPVLPVTHCLPSLRLSFSGHFVFQNDSSIGDRQFNLNLKINLLTQNNL